MLNHILQIANYIFESFLHTWPYLLITIPIAVGVKMSGASKYINRAFTAQPVLAIVLATLVGAFSPLCSCSVIPVIAALLIGGVPLAPVMSFWLASPSMDPEIFFLTVSELGWDLAAWRLVATLIMSLGGGFITHALVQRNWLGEQFLRDSRSTRVKTSGEILKDAWHYIWTRLRSALTSSSAITSNATLATNQATNMVVYNSTLAYPHKQTPVVNDSSCGCNSVEQIVSANDTCSLTGTSSSTCAEAQQVGALPFWKRLTVETWDATTMVVKFMLIAWFLGALIRLYVPDAWITTTLGKDNPWAIITAAILGIPVYTSNLAAMPLIGGLLAGGMHPAAALAFLIAGPTTTLPAMSAVWGLVNRKVFALYIGFSLFGAIVLAYLYSFIS